MKPNTLPPGQIVRLVFFPAHIAAAGCLALALPAPVTLTGSTPGSVPRVATQTWYGTADNTGNAADNADPFHTGIQNLAVFALLGPSQNPSSARPSQLPQVQRSSDCYFFSFTEPAEVGGITYGAEWTQTLLPASWTTISDSGTPPQHVFSVPIGTRTSLYMRLKVTEP